MSHLAVFAISSNIRKQTSTGHNTTNYADINDDLDFANPDDDMDEDIKDIVDDDMLIATDNMLELSQQPLAVALWISNSTMPTGMPAWFGPLNRNQPTAIRVALHINLSSLTDMQQTGETAHPLDMSQPATTLRYIVENLEQLSWLTSRASTRSLQRSALPVHVTAIGRLHRELTQLTQRVQQFQQASQQQQQQQQPMQPTA